MLGYNEFDDLEDDFEDFDDFMNGDVEVVQLPNPIPRGYFDDISN